MDRRKFVQSGIVASAAPTGLLARQQLRHPQNDGREIYEWRAYDLRWRTDKQLLMSFVKEVLKPAMIAEGVNHFLVFEDMHKTAQKRLRLLISYPSMEVYLRAQIMQSQQPFVEAAADYSAVPVDRPIYDRFESSLLLAFLAQPQMIVPKPDASVFELRIYEGYSEDAVRRKIKMFNDGEIPIFNDAGLYPIFFGEMLAGSLRPCLVYMVHCKDMEAHATGWKAFGKHPDWIAMKDKEEYANTVSNIRNVFLTLI